MARLQRKLDEERVEACEQEAAQAAQDRLVLEGRITRRELRSKGLDEAQDAAGSSAPGDSSGPAKGRT